MIYLHIAASNVVEVQQGVRISHTYESQPIRGRGSQGGYLEYRVFHCRRTDFFGLDCTLLFLFPPCVRTIQVVALLLSNCRAKQYGARIWSKAFHVLVLLWLVRLA